MIYRVTKRYGRSSESNVGSFKSVPEARAFIQTAMENDALLKINATYSIYEGADLLEEVDQSQMQKTQATSSDNASSSSQSQGAGQRFSPSPLSTRPQPRGMPQSSWKDDESDKGKK